MKLCLDSDGSGLSDMEDVLSNWHKECDSSIAFKPTTPAIVSLTSTYNSEECTAIASACVFGSSIGADCLSSYGAATQSAQLSSCFCQGRYLSAASVCEYDLNKTCIGTTAAHSDIAIWSLCPVSSLRNWFKPVLICHRTRHHPSSQLSPLQPLHLAA